MPQPISPQDRSLIDRLMEQQVPDITTFRWLHMQQWKTSGGPKVGRLAVQINGRDLEGVERYAPFPPCEVLSIAEGFVLFEDGRRVPADMVEHCEVGEGHPEK